MFYPLLIPDIIEIAFCSFMLYAFAIWLKTDKLTNLLPYFLGYCSITIIAWTAQLQTVSTALLTYAPVATIIFILLHEKTLQRNFVTLHNPAPKTETPADWIDSILSSALSLINTEKSITVIIENHDVLTTYLKAPFYINTRISKELVDILLTSDSFDQEKMVWIDTQGYIRSINSVWKNQGDSAYEDALLYTSHTDAVIFNANPVRRTFTFFAQGKYYADITPHQVRMFIQQQTAVPQSYQHKKNKGVSHEEKPTP